MLLLRLAAGVDGVQEDIGAERRPHRRRLQSQIIVVRGRRRGEEAVEQRPRIVVAVDAGRLDRIAQPIRLLEPGGIEQDRDDAVVVDHLARLDCPRGTRAGAHLPEVAASQQRLKQRRLPGVGVSDDGEPKGRHSYASPLAATTTRRRAVASQRRAA